VRVADATEVMLADGGGIFAALTAVAGRDRGGRAAPGRFRMDVRGDGHASGRFVEVTPPRRVVFTWGWEIAGSPVSPVPAPSRWTSNPTGIARWCG
jgi:uncharacterized protein YndB with AHSA1/START domain